MKAVRKVYKILQELAMSAQNIINYIAAIIIMQ